MWWYPVQNIEGSCWWIGFSHYKSYQFFCKSILLYLPSKNHRSLSIVPSISKASEKQFDRQLYECLTHFIGPFSTFRNNRIDDRSLEDNPLNEEEIFVDSSYLSMDEIYQTLSKHKYKFWILTFRVFTVNFDWSPWCKNAVLFIPPHMSTLNYAQQCKLILFWLTTYYISINILTP